MTPPLPAHGPRPDPPRAPTLRLADDRANGRRDLRPWVIGAAIAALAFVALPLALLAGMRCDTADMRRRIATQQHLLERQLTLLERQVELSAATLEESRRALLTVRQTRLLTDEIEDGTQQLIALTRRLLEQVRDMNRRTGGGLTRSR